MSCLKRDETIYIILNISIAASTIIITNKKELKRFKNEISNAYQYDQVMSVKTSTCSEQGGMLAQQNKENNGTISKSFHINIIGREYV